MIDTQNKQRVTDSTRVVISTGKPSERGTGLGKVSQKTVTLAALRKKFMDPYVDLNTTFGEYQKQAKIAKDLTNPKHKLAAERVLAMKQAPGNWSATRYSCTNRKVGDIISKTMLVFDIDHATPEQTATIREGLTAISDHYWVAHTSRSHYPEKPKFRVAIFVDREMKPDEAHAILRLAGTLFLDDPQESLEIIDTVTFRPNQTMFWPGMSKMQDYWWDENPLGHVLCVDEFLAKHPGWENYENLPYQESEAKHGLKDPSVKMEDPREKIEPIGAFCRLYDVEDAIAEFLSEIYVPSESASDTRYSYVAGTSNNGAVVYDEGLFLNSMHGSDPASGMHNAFDLVRIHLFGHLDTAVHGNTAPGNLPSFKAMVAMCRKDLAVISEEFAYMDCPVDDDEDDPLGSMLDDLEAEDDEDDAPKKKTDRAWMAHMRRKGNDDFEPVLNNAALICANDERIAPCIGYNDFTLVPVCFKPVRAFSISTPSPEVKAQDRNNGRPWDDKDDTSCLLIMSANKERGGFELEMANDKLQDAILAAGMQHKIHPIKDYLKVCHVKWTKAGRPTGAIERLAIDYLKTPDTPFHRESARMFLTAAIARIEEPGCKFDQMVILEGPTGSRKSTFFEVLFNGFCTDLDADLDDTGRLIENIRGNWCKEMAEMKVAKRADANTLKRTLSASSDTHRLAYGRREHTYPRQNVFVGTSNEDDYLADPTSSRRYWVWRTPTNEEHPIDTDLLEQERAMLWGEAYQAYLDMRAADPRGSLWLDIRSPEARKERDCIANGSRKRTAVEEIADVLADWLDTPTPACEAFQDEDGRTPDEYDGDSTPMIRNMVTAKMAYVAMEHEAALRAYRSADSRTFGKALSLVTGWKEVGKVRRHGRQAVWHCRTSAPELWIQAKDFIQCPDEEDGIDLLS